MWLRKGNLIRKRVERKPHQGVKRNLSMLRRRMMRRKKKKNQPVNPSLPREEDDPRKIPLKKNQKRKQNQQRLRKVRKEDGGKHPRM
jgi:hypothetical protein